MKRNKIILSALFLFAFTGKVMAERGSSLPDSPHIAVTGSSELSVKPDIAVVNFNLTSDEKTPLAAKQILDDKIKQFLETMAEFNLAQENIVASRVNVRANRRYINNRSTNGQQIEMVSYYGSRDLSVTVTDLSLLSNIINKALSLGINNINNMTMKHSDEASLLAQVNGQAINDAKSKATAFASAFDASLGHVYSVNVNSQNKLPSYNAGHGMERMSVSSELSTGGQFIQDNITFTASINVVFKITPIDQ